MAKPTIQFSQSEVVLHSNAAKYRKIWRTRQRTFLKMVGWPFYLICQFWARPISPANRYMMSKIWTNEVQLSDRVKNMGKGEIARYEQFLLFPQCFHKLSVVDTSK